MTCLINWVYQIPHTDESVERMSYYRANDREVESLIELEFQIIGMARKVRLMP